MNTKELKAEIVRHGDTALALAEFLGIANPTMSNKINGKAEFSQTEMQMIIDRYELSANRIVEIFFSPDVA